MRYFDLYTYVVTLKVKIEFYIYNIEIVCITRDGDMIKISNFRFGTTVRNIQSNGWIKCQINVHFKELLILLIEVISPQKLE